ncbi:flagellar assembly protein FliW [Cryobacterium melibiosiphilum]|uniref:Flagellar assembly protein FliW n=1 Tax=Cryobacterium melibiosiphilum TaxID=995039 RepID=A0A3A5MM54_9MICO|nr:flagellar assembly protein FliW [Cryobacterium melibiosiphilum]RJT88198.1 flagellar assembly protein FliW [Cryobacterium melibiosiphilum]
MNATLSFVTPPPGLAPLTAFSLTEIEGATGLFALQALDAVSTRLFVLDAAAFLPHYTPYISAEQQASLALTAPKDALVLVVVNPGDAAASAGAAAATTVNLMAPIVVNSATGAAAQLILEGQDWPLQAALTPHGA